jgi:hypothetical protein
VPWAPDYVDLAEFREYVRIHVDADDTDDSELEDAMEGAFRAVDGECQRQFGKTDNAEARYYVPRWSKTRRLWLVATDDIPTSVGLTVHLDTAQDGTFVTAVTSYLLRPSNSDKRGKPWEGLAFAAPAGAIVRGSTDEVRLSAAAGGFGWTAVPRTVTLASKMQGSRFLSRRDAPFGVAGNLEQGSELRLLAKVDPDVAVMLKDYRRRVKLR